MRGIIGTQKEAGFVSLLTVVMFMILTTIVTVSFVTLTLGEQRQTLNDDLAKGAYEASQAGIEDAKRAIRYCKNNGCEAALYNQSCPGFFLSGAVTSGLGISPVNGTVRVGDASANQRYTCVTVSNQISKYWGELDPNSASAQTLFLPLKSDQSFNRVKISWSQKTGTSTVPNSLTSSNPTRPNWQSGWPAMMRAMIMDHPTGNITETNITSRSSFFVPHGSGTNSTSQASMGSRIMTRCNASAMGGAGNIDADYVCSMTIDGVGGAARDWYLQLAPYYQAAAFKVELFNGSNPVKMSDVGYLVDSTGAVADVYRRVQVLLGPDDVVSPSSAIQSGEKLCKNIAVTGLYGSPLSLNENCSPSAVAPPPVVPPPGPGGVVAELGGWCSLNTCDSDDGGSGNDGTPDTGPPTDYTQRIYNVSENSSGEVAGCTWVISDGTRIDDKYCNYGDSFVHTFPTTPYPPKVKYTVTLTVRSTAGTQAVYTGTFNLPKKA